MLKLPGGSLVAPVDGLTWSMRRPVLDQSSLYPYHIKPTYGETEITGTMRLSDESWALRAPPLELEIEADHRRIRLHGVEIDTLDSNGDCTFTAQSITYDVVPGEPGPEPKPETTIVMPRLFDDVAELVRVLQE